MGVCFFVCHPNDIFFLFDNLTAAGPPSIIKNPLRTKALLERPVPVINVRGPKKIKKKYSGKEGETITERKNDNPLLNCPPRQDIDNNYSQNLFILIGLCEENSFSSVPIL